MKNIFFRDHYYFFMSERFNLETVVVIVWFIRLIKQLEPKTCYNLSGYSPPSNRTVHLNVVHNNLTGWGSSETEKKQFLKYKNNVIVKPIYCLNLSAVFQNIFCSLKQILFYEN